MDETLVTIRRKQMMTGVALAKQLGIDSSMQWKIEHGKVSFPARLILPWSQAIGVSVARMLRLIEDMHGE